MMAGGAGPARPAAALELLGRSGSQMMTSTTAERERPDEASCEVHAREHHHARREHDEARAGPVEGGRQAALRRGAGHAVRVPPLTSDGPQCHTGRAVRQRPPEVADPGAPGLLLPSHADLRRGGPHRAGAESSRSARRACRRTTAIRGDPRRAGRRPRPRARAPPHRAHGGERLRVLPGHGRLWRGSRPLTEQAEPGWGCAGTRTWRTSGSSVTAADPRVRSQRLRRVGMGDRGNGTSSDWSPASSSPDTSTGRADSGGPRGAALIGGARLRRGSIGAGAKRSPLQALLRPLRRPGRASAPSTATPARPSTRRSRRRRSTPARVRRRS